MSKRLTIAAVTRKPDAASFQQRVRRYVEPLAERGIDVTCLTFPKRGKGPRLRELAGYDGVWWQRHLIHPFWLRRWRRSARLIVFDFDDPVCFTARDGGGTNLARSFKFAAVLKRCDSVLAGSDTLARLARRYCADVHVVPMAVDLPDTLPQRDAAATIELLWVGSIATQPYLEIIRRPLQHLAERGAPVRLRLVAHEPMTFGGLEVDYRPWSPQAQNDGLQACHIGLCPMPDTLWTAGKCPYKVLQYMAHAMPWVGSAVGENITAAGRDDEPRGLCAADDADWTAALTRLIDDGLLREQLGARGRAYVERHHGREAIADRLAALWHGFCES